MVSVWDRDSEKKKIMSDLVRLSFEYQEQQVNPDGVSLSEDWTKHALYAKDVASAWDSLKNFYVYYQHESNRYRNIQITHYTIDKIDYVDEIVFEDESNIW